MVRTPRPRGAHLRPAIQALRLLVTWLGLDADDARTLVVHLWAACIVVGAGATLGLAWRAFALVSGIGDH